MTIAIGSAPAFTTWRSKIRDFNLREVTKTTILDGTTDDTHLLQLITDLDAVTNGQIVTSDFNARKVTGLKSSATLAAYGQVTNEAVLTFSKVDPVNALKTVSKSFIIPTLIPTLVNTDLSLVDGTAAGSGSVEAQLGRIIANLQTYLNYLGADGTYYPGSWTYESGESKEITIPGD